MLNNSINLGINDGVNVDVNGNDTLNEDKTMKSSSKGSSKSSHMIIELISTNPTISIDAMADKIGISKRAVAKQISKLKGLGIIERKGSHRAGLWEIANNTSE